MHTHEIETRRELNDDVPGARVVVCVCSCVPRLYRMDRRKLYRRNSSCIREGGTKRDDDEMEVEVTSSLRSSLRSQLFLSVSSPILINIHTHTHTHRIRRDRDDILVRTRVCSLALGRPSCSSSKS